MKTAWRSLGTGATLIILLTVVAYLPALHGGFIWDDDAYVTENRLLTAPDGLKRIWFSAHHESQYFPLVFTTLRFERMLWDLNPIGYHAVNVLLHGMNALLVWAVLRRLAVPGAWLAAAIWAVHPVNAESAAWITELKNTQSTLFYLLALLAWMKFTDSRTVRPWRFYALALLLQALALFSKTTACTLPAAMLLVLWLRKQPIGLRRFVQVAPFLVFGIAMGLLSVWWEAHLGNYGAELNFPFSGLERLLIATRALWFYAAKLVWPMGLTFSYSRWEINPRDPLQYMPLIGCVAVALLLWWRRNVWGRAPVVAVIFFVAALSPLLGFIPLYTFRYSFVADHYQYVASMGMIGLVVGAGVVIFQRAGQRGRDFGTFAAVVALLVLGICTWQRGLIYKDLETLWRDTLAKNPDAWMPHNNLGLVLAGQGKTAEAIAEYAAALRIKPDYVEAHYNLGNALAGQGRVAEAIAEYAAALQIKPDFAGAHNNLANTLIGQGRLAEAVAELQAALRIKPDFAEAHYNLGNALAGQGRISEATTEYRETLRLRPDFAEAHSNLGLALAGQGKFAEATAEYQAALRIRPDLAWAHQNLGNALASQGKIAEATAEYAAAVRIKPDFAEAHNNLANTLIRQGRLAEAVAECQAVLRIKPDNVEAHYNLGVALANQRRISEAVAEYRETLRLRPDWPPALGGLAWILATSSNESVRGGGEAVQLAERLCAVSGCQEAEGLDVLAAAYAEAGRFDDAVRVAQRAVEAATAAGPGDLAGQIQERLKLYRASRPYRAGPAQSP